MISGATRGSGRGDALPAHLLKSENEVTVIPARGLGCTTLHEQVRELVAQSAGGRTDRPIYHVFCSPDPRIAEDAAVRQRFWTLFETEFGMAGQPYCGVEHRKCGRLHEHRIYGIVRPSGAVVDLAWDYVRREKCGRIVEFEHGMEAVPSKHARSIARRLRQDGRADVSDWLVASGCTESVRPVARLAPCERATEERTDVALDDLRRATLSAWRETSDGPAFMAALRVRGLDLRRGRVGPVIMDATGTAHLATRVLGAASRRFEGARIPAATVKARLGDLQLGETRMDDADIVRRLDTQERLLHAILAALGPPEQDGSGFDDLVETLSDLTVAVSDVTDAVRALRWDGSARSPRPAGSSSGEG